MTVQKETSAQNDGLYRHMVDIRRWSLFQVRHDYCISRGTNTFLCDRSEWLSKARLFCSCKKIIFNRIFCPDIKTENNKLFLFITLGMKKYLNVFSLRVVKWGWVERWKPLREITVMITFWSLLKFFRVRYIIRKNIKIINP